MNREAIFHNPVSNYAFPISYEKFKVRLRAGKGDLDRVTLVIGNKYLWHTRKEVPMEVEGSDELFDYYSYVYPVDDPRVAYYFLLEKGDEQWLYGDSGFAKPELVNIDEDESSAFVNFHFPFINRIDIHKKPSWVNSAVFYQIFPERFCNGNPKLSPENVAPWGTAPDRQIFMGGDLPGITQKLSYLEELGVNALYLTPIFEATSNHKYDTVDYTRIDPHFGDESDLVELINQAHKRGIRVILDGVFNHCGGGFRQFQDVVEHGEESPFRDWFYIREFPVSFDPLNFDSFGDTPYTPRHPGLKNLSEEQLRTACMPKWNTENPQAKEYLLKSVEEDVKHDTAKLIKELEAKAKEEADKKAKAAGAEYTTKDYKDILADKDIDAVIICSSTDTHSPISIEAIKAGKHVFCEKPIDHDVDKIKEVIKTLEGTGLKYQVGFNRRFDHNFEAAQRAVVNGKIGAPHIIKITSRDPEPPSAEYVKVSGGMFLDMTIHDFDMVRFLAGCDAEEVYVQAANLVDPEIGKAGDVDTAIITLKMENGALAVIDNSRQAVYGYDQRAEVFGSKGMVAIKNDSDSTAVISNEDGVTGEKPQFFFLERYMDAYGKEMVQFIDAIENDTETPLGVEDGLKPVLMGLAAKKSVEEGRPVKISEIEF